MTGEIVAGRYRIVRLLGQGGMGSVYEATHTTTGRRVAIKVISAGEVPAGDPRVSRFQREARAAGALVTDHIAHVLDAGEDPITGAPFMVMELLEGEDLAQLLKKTGPLRPEAALRIAAQACLGLQKAHEAGVIHRDIKPANLFLCRREEGAVVVKLLDFGIAKIRMDDTVDAQTALTNTGSVLGSPHYLSPEQARASKDVDPRTDVWSLGVTLYRALTGRTPHEKLDSFINLMMAICLQPAPPVQSLAPWVPAEIADVVHRALAIDRDARFPGAAAMLDAIRPLLPGGWALDPSMLVPLDDRERAVVAPVSTTLHPAAVTAETPDAIPRPPAPSAAPPGVAPVPPTGGRRALVLGAVGLAGVAAVASFLIAARAGHDGGHPQTPGAGRPPWALTTPASAEGAARPAASFALETPAPSPTSPAATRRVSLVIEPSDATAEVDGAPATSDRGVVTIEGPLGSTHRVRVRKGTSVTDGDVAITESGALPAKIELLPAAAAATAPRGTGRTGGTAGPIATAAAAPPPTAAASAKLRTSFE